ncbi:beta-N-acetylhexosaminidase [Terrabacter sp. MAHUQ-38]|uniref:beta-N-acetylhexosaminidase n=1 Tax=unclassified Terrabacter TaxID=2630222 RepID=UPI00165DBE10|nr:beta-N-acetylhexosaminidase [Terrabacter sp. MAHUQ-38]MBC9820369.1 beta-N-acetylhexosaminidase [Terrabacter sp. MAHUQ-38]
MDTSREALRRLVTGTLMPGFVGTSVPGWVGREYAAGLASVCLYGANIVDPDQLARLCAQLRAAAPDLVVAVDEEGGDVTRLHYPTGSTQPGNALLGRLDDTALTRASASAIGHELAAYGINLDLAPVVDVNSADENPVIGVRSFGADAAAVARHSAAYVEGVQSVGVAACAKHFPGHGDTVIDSHLDVPHVHAEAHVLDTRELEPFRTAIGAGVACVMTSHVVVSAIDPDRPATFSPLVLGEVLRGRLGFEGVIVSDALDMAGASAETGIPEAAVRALAAGCDLLCVGSETTEECYLAVVDAVVDAATSGRLPVGRLEDASARVALLSKGFGAPGQAVSADAGLSRWGNGSLVGGFAIGDAVQPWLDADGDAVIVQVASDVNLAVGRVAWGPSAAGLTTGEADVQPGAKVAVAGRGLSDAHPLWDVVDRLRAQGHPTIVVDCGWPRGGADLVTFGGSVVVAEALGRYLGVRPT